MHFFRVNQVVVCFSPGILVASLADNGPPIKVVLQEDEEQPEHDDES